MSSSTKLVDLPEEILNIEQETPEITQGISVRNNINTVVVFIMLLLASNSRMLPWKYPKYILSILLSVILSVVYYFIAN
jgi:hypothetical protein